MQRWLITGASGQLGGHVVRLLTRRAPAVAVLALTGPGGGARRGGNWRQADLADFAGLEGMVAEFRPDVVVHLAAMTSVAECHAAADLAVRLNTEATGVLARAAAQRGARFVFCSTDMVFDGEAAPYCETDAPQPVSHYGRTKAAAERLVLEQADALVVRVPLMLGLPCTPRETTFVGQLAALRTGQPVRLFTDEYRTPVWLADAARALIGLGRADVRGVLHVAGPERLSRFEIIARCAELLGLSQATLMAVSRRDLAGPEPRPADLSLAGDRLAREFPDLLPGPLRAEMFQEVDGEGRGTEPPRG